jgi:diphthamide biosynthesis protein 2
VDEVAAQHAKADSIIHFGKSCLSPTSRLPVLYVFGHRALDEDKCSGVFQEFFGGGGASQPVVVMYDVVFSHCIGESVVFFFFFFYASRLTHKA